MGCFIAIAVPRELQLDVLAFREQRGYKDSEPHIKVISPALLENTPIVHHKLESFCLSQPELTVTLGHPLTSNNLLLYLPVADDGVKQMRERLLDHLQVKPTLVNYRPHLTLVRQSGGMDMDRYLQEAREAFGTPFTFPVSEAVLYTTQADGTYAPERRIAFSGRQYD